MNVKLLHIFKRIMNRKTKGSLKLKVPWGHVAAKTWGNPEKTHILVVHGIMDNAGAFDRLIAQLPENFYYVCIDLPGHGLSSHFPSGIMLSYFSFILAIRYVLDELKWDRTYYMGHSFGAHLGALFSIIYPDRIQKLILIDGIIAGPLTTKEVIKRIQGEHNLAIEESGSNNPRLYTKEEVIYALCYLRMCCLNTQGAEALFERAVTKVDNKYHYNRDIRAKLTINPYFDMDQALYIVDQLKVQILLILASNTLPKFMTFRENLKSVLNNKKNITIVEVEGNHDVHNNYPERISRLISQYFNLIPSKL